RRRRLRTRAPGEVDDLLDLDDELLTASAAQTPAAGAALDEQLGDQPVPVALLLDRDVGDDGVPAAVAERDLPVDQLADDQRLARALGEAADVEQPGGDHGAGGDAHHAGDRQEDAALPGDLDDAAHHPGQPLAADEDDDVVHLADRVAERVEHGRARQPADEDPVGRGPAHRCAAHVGKPMSNGPAPPGGGSVAATVPTGENRAMSFMSSRGGVPPTPRSEEHTSELQSRENLVCRLLLEKKKTQWRKMQRPSTSWTSST